MKKLLSVNEIKKDFFDYKTLLKTCIKDTYSITKSRFGIRSSDKPVDSDAQTPTGKEKLKKTVGIIGIAFVALILIAYLVSFTVIIADSFIADGQEMTFVYAALLIAQIAVLFLGSVATLNYLYFGKDNLLLLNLPIKSHVVFAVKLTLAYISQLLIGAAISLPILLTFGIFSSLHGGFVFGAGYYIFSVLSVFILPIIPLLAVSLIIIPLMGFVSLFRNRELGKNIVTIAISLCMSALYILIIFANSGLSGEGESSAAMLGGVRDVIAALSKASIFNYSLVLSLFGAVGHFFAYLAEILCALVLVIVISAAFYKKGLSVMIESGSVTASDRNNKKKSVESFKQSSFAKTFLIKEFRSMLGNSQFLIGFIIGIIVIPVICVVMTKTQFIVSFGEEDSVFSQEMFLLGMVSYIASLLIVTTGSYSCSAFSLEGQNFSMLKSLPIKPKTVLNSKVIFSMTMSAILALVSAVSFIAVSPSHNFLVSLLMFLVLLTNGFASTSIGLYNDIKKPNFRFTNFTELNKNNTRILKPMLINILVSLVYVIMATLLSSVTDEDDNTLSPVVCYAIFFAVSFLICGLFAFICGKKLYDNIDEFFERAEP